MKAITRGYPDPNQVPASVLNEAAPLTFEREDDLISLHYGNTLLLSEFARGWKNGRMKTHSLSRSLALVTFDVINCSHYEGSIAQKRADGKNREKGTRTRGKKNEDETMKRNNGKRKGNKKESKDPRDQREKN